MIRTMLKDQQEMAEKVSQAFLIFQLNTIMPDIIREHFSSQLTQISNPIRIFDTHKLGEGIKEKYYFYIGTLASDDYFVLEVDNSINKVQSFYYSNSEHELDTEVPVIPEDELYLIEYQ